MNYRKVLLYGAVPALASTVFHAMYFSDHLVLRRLVSPKLPPLWPGSWREFGLLETSQHLMLLAMAGIALAGLWRKRHGGERIAFAAIALFAAFVLLEEIDYGQHFKNYLTSEHDFEWFEPANQWPPELVASIDLETEPLNLHNRGNLTDIIKFFVQAGGLLFFVVFPFIAPRLKIPWLRYIAPDRYAVLTIAVMGAFHLITHTLGDWEREAIARAVASGGPVPEAGAMRNNLSEFREFNTYYLFLVYLAVLVFFRKSPGPAHGDASRGARAADSGTRR